MCDVCYLPCVARDKTIIDVLAALPSDELGRMREKNQRDLARAKAELARLELQEQQFEQAAMKKERGKPGRPGALTLELVLDAASDTEPPMSAGDVRETLKGQGHVASVNAVRNHLNRLVQQGELEKDKNARYSVARPVFVPDDFAPSNASTA